MQRKEVTTTTFSVLNDFAIIITTERYRNGKTNLILPSENLRLYSSSLPTEFTSKSAASSVLFPSLQDQRQKCQKSVRSFKCDIGSQKNKIINFANKLHLGEANKQRKKSLLQTTLYWMACLVKNFRYTYSITVKRSWEKMIKKLRIWQLSFKNGIYSKMIKSWVLTIGHIEVIHSHFSTVSIPLLSKPQANHNIIKRHKRFLKSWNVKGDQALYSFEK